MVEVPAGRVVGGWVKEAGGGEAGLRVVARVGRGWMTWRRVEGGREREALEA